MPMPPRVPNQEEPDHSPPARVRSPAALGRLARRERKRQRLTLDTVYSATGLSTRFLSEFERGKPNASLGRAMQALQALGLELVVLSRGDAERLMARQGRSESAPDGGTAS